MPYINKCFFKHKNIVKNLERNKKDTIFALD